MKKEHLLRLQPGVAQRIQVTSLEEDFAKIGLTMETREKRERGTAKAVSRAIRSADRADARHFKAPTPRTKEDAAKASERMVGAMGNYSPKGLSSTKKESIDLFYDRCLEEGIISGLKRVGRKLAVAGAIAGSAMGASGSARAAEPTTTVKASAEPKSDQFKRTVMDKHTKDMETAVRRGDRKTIKRLQGSHKAQLDQYSTYRASERETKKESIDNLREAFGLGAKKVTGRAIVGRPPSKSYDSEMLKQNKGVLRQK